MYWGVAPGRIVLYCCSPHVNAPGERAVQGPREKSDFQAEGSNEGKEAKGLDVNTSEVHLGDGSLPFPVVEDSCLATGRTHRAELTALWAIGTLDKSQVDECVGHKLQRPLRSQTSTRRQVEARHPCAARRAKGPPSTMHVEEEEKREFSNRLSFCAPSSGPPWSDLQAIPLLARCFGIAAHGGGEDMRFRAGVVLRQAERRGSREHAD
ncbi:hypothetical protein AXG93_4492s1240 [Marchantia polymorpha subsp. ruderalis]|uniref:Uncharacterized protein n=1 Tax=Marchantia polymorpha subsp. ruderalis TaxID=1480154 RepID=A0A176W695_MARPO|nr:hypothetical protein AXG93_4492s1240 [Marchantia polymorpha subsp. ruderalis]